MSDISINLPLDETILSLIVQVVSLTAEIKLQRAYMESLSKIVNQNLESAYEKIHADLYHQTFVEQLDKLYLSLSDGLRDLILLQIEAS